MSLPITWPVPIVPPPPRVAVAVPVKPSAANAVVLVLVTDRFEVVPECSVIEPPLIAGRDCRSRDRVDLAPASVPMLSVMLSWLPAAPDATKVMTCGVDRDGVAARAKLAEIELVPASAVEQGREPVFATDGVALLF